MDIRRRPLRKVCLRQATERSGKAAVLFRKSALFSLAAPSSSRRFTRQGERWCIAA